jgi:hypothetical protein
MGEGENGDGGEGVCVCVFVRDGHEGTGKEHYMEGKK